MSILRSESNLSNGQQFTQNVQQPSRNYVLENLENLPQLAIEAAKLGDDTVLRLLLNFPYVDPKKSIVDYQQHYLFNQTKERLLRALKIISTQIEILENAYNTYKEKILSYKADIENLLNLAAHQLSHKFRLTHRKMLAENDSIFTQDGKVQLNLTLRVALHKKFSETLIDEFKLYKPKLDEFHSYNTFTKYRMLLESVRQILDQLAQLEKDHDLNNQNIEASNSNKKRALQNQHKIKFSALMELNRDTCLKSASSIQIQKLSDLKQFSLNAPEIRDQANNNLLHIALFSGNFKTAQLLIDNGFDYKLTNNQNIKAIDTQDKQGNTLLHYYALQGDFVSVTKFLNYGAKCNIKNKNGDTVFDIETNNNSLIHLLLKKITDENSQTHLDTLLTAIATPLKIKHLMMKNVEGKTAREIIYTLSNAEIKSIILDKLKQQNESLTFTSKFQSDVNTLLWYHFNNLDRQIVPFYKQFFMENIKVLCTKQLYFLMKLQNELLTAIENGCDTNLRLFLKENISSIVMPKVIENGYTLYLDLADECTQHPNSTYLAKQKNSTYKNLQSISHPSPNNIGDGEQPTYHYKPPVTLHDLRKPRQIDPMGWFVKHSLTKETQNTEYANDETRANLVSLK